MSGILSNSQRALAAGLGAVAAALLFFMVNPWVTPDPAILPAVTVTFWIASIALVVVLFEERKDPAGQVAEIEGPAFTRFLFSNSRAGLLWLPIRLFVGFTWLEAGYHKFSTTGWLDGGASLAAYWQRAATIPEKGSPPITYDWYRDFINFLLAGHHERWFAWVITFGEMAVGVGLILGALTGIAAFFGAFMNMSFLLAGSASSNPVMFTLAVGLILAWKVAGYYGVDRYILPRLGTPWRPGVVFGRRQTQPASA